MIAQRERTVIKEGLPQLFEVIDLFFFDEIRGLRKSNVEGWSGMTGEAAG
jgi:hypothetical protein